MSHIHEDLLEACAMGRLTSYHGRRLPAAFRTSPFLIGFAVGLCSELANCQFDDSTLLAADTTTAVALVSWCTDEGSVCFGFFHANTQGTRHDHQ